MALPPQQNRHGLLSSYLSQRTTMPLPPNPTPLSLEEASVNLDATTEAEASLNPDTPPQHSKKLPLTRLLAVVLVLALAVGLYFIWSPAPTATTTPSITHQNFGQSAGTAQGTTGAASHDANSIQVYVVGAVKHPGIYILPTNARVYQLLQAAGGPLPNANLVSLNLAARLNDGQEVYVTVQGEKPPTYIGGVPAPGSTGSTGSSNTDLVNINTASSQEMQQKLHISSTTATTIINYRTQHGLYTSVEQLAAVVSKSIYDKIKGQVTV
jgi:competence protein ComEA